METLTLSNSQPASRKHKHRYAALAASVLGNCMQWSGVQSYLLRRPAIHLVYLHHTPDFAWLERLLLDLSRDFVFIDHDEAVSRIRSGKEGKPAISFSFDDGFASCKPAVKVLEQFGTRGLIYICPGLVGRDDPGVAQFFGGQQPEGVLDWDSIIAIKSAGHLIGSHTVTHRNLAKLPPSELSEELESSRQIILSELGICDHFAWPFGRMQFFSQQAFQFAVMAGYKSIASGIRGSHRVASDGMLCRHVIHPGQTAESLKRFLALSLAGLDGHTRSRKWITASNAQNLS